MMNDNGVQMDMDAAGNGGGNSSNPHKTKIIWKQNSGNSRN